MGWGNAAPIADMKRAHAQAERARAIEGAQLHEATQLLAAIVAAYHDDAPLGASVLEALDSAIDAAAAFVASS